MNISTWSDSVVRLEDFVRDDTINAFVLGSKTAIEKAIQTKSKCGVCVKVGKGLFCEIIERLMGWKYDGELNSFFCVSSYCKMTMENNLLLAHMTDGLSTIVAEYNEYLDSWIVDKGISKKFITNILLKDSNGDDFIDSCYTTIKEIEEN